MGARVLINYCEYRLMGGNYLLSPIFHKNRWVQLLALTTLLLSQSNLSKKMLSYKGSLKIYKSKNENIQTGLHKFSSFLKMLVNKIFDKIGKE